MQPGQFFTEYVDSIPKLKKHVHVVDYMIMEKVAERVRKEAHFFALPLNGQLTNRSSAVIKPCGGEIFRPPYKFVVLEYEAASDSVPVGMTQCPKRIVIAMDVGGEAVHLLPCLFNEKEQRWVPHIYMAAIRYDNPKAVSIMDGNLHTHATYTFNLPKLYEAMLASWGGNEVSFKRQMAIDLSDEVHAYLDFCIVLHNHEVTFDEVAPDAAKNRFRRARGKAPLFTYKVLTIGKKKRKSRHLGGTHASPRSHLRRGYFRRSKNGVRHWVQPCMVKGDTSGFVHKDYKVEGQSQCNF